MVVVVVNGPFVRVVEVAHVAIVVDVKRRVAIGPAGTELVHSVGRRGVGVPKIVPCLRHRAKVCIRQSHRVVARGPWSAVKLHEVLLVVVSSCGHRLAVEVNRVRPLTVSTTNAISVAVVDDELQAWVRICIVDAHGVCIRRACGAVRTSRKQQSFRAGQRPSDFAGVVVGEDFNNHFRLGVGALGVKRLRDSAEEREGAQRGGQSRNKVHEIGIRRVVGRGRRAGFVGGGQSQRSPKAPSTRSKSATVVAPSASTSTAQGAW